MNVEGKYFGGNSVRGSVSLQTPVIHVLVGSVSLCSYQKPTNDVKSAEYASQTSDTPLLSPNTGHIPLLYYEIELLK